MQYLANNPLAATWLIVFNFDPGVLFIIPAPRQARKDFMQQPNVTAHEDGWDVERVTAIFLVILRTRTEMEANKIV